MDPENVKERLNTLLHKKLSENERKSKEAEGLNENHEDPNETADKKQKTDGYNLESEKCNTASSTTTAAGELDPSSSEYLCTHYLLHEILSEKKKALLQNKERKTSDSPYCLPYCCPPPHSVLLNK